MTPDGRMPALREPPAWLVGVGVVVVVLLALWCAGCGRAPRVQRAEPAAPVVDAPPACVGDDCEIPGG